MAPKAKSGGAKAKAKAKEKAADKEPTEAELKAEKDKVMKQDAEESYDRYAEEGGEKMKLKGFAEAIRALNIKKLQPWDDNDIGGFIKDQWKDCGGFANKEVSKEAYVGLWPSLVEKVEAKVQERQEAEEKKEAEKAEQAKAKANKYAGDGIWEVPLKDLEEATKEAYKKDKTPLIIDNTEGLRSEAFFTYSGAHVIECKKMIMDKAKGEDVKDVLEGVRSSFFGGKCFKYGQTVVFRLANTACDIKSMFNSEEFPSLALLDAAQVRKCLGNDNADNFKGSAFDKMCPNDDERMEMICGINEKFRVVAITHFQVEDYAGFLEPMFPLDLCQPMKVMVD